MDTQRLLLLIIFSFSVLMLWEAWQKENRPPVAQPSAAATKDGTPGAVPAPATKASDGAPTTAGAVPATGAEATASRPRVKVTTDLVIAEIDSLGGDLVRLELLKHRDPERRDHNLVLLGPEHRYALQSGLTTEGAPNHKTLFTPAQTEYTLAPGADTVDVKLEATGPTGIKVVKTYRFNRNSYLINLTEEVINGTGAPLATTAYFHLTRDNRPPPGDQAMMPTYNGPAVYTEASKYQKMSWSDVDKNKPPYPTTTQTDGWVAVIQHYFVAALLPAPKTNREFYTEKISDGFYRAGFKSPLAPIEPGATGSISVPVYLGPQEQSTLEHLAPGLPLVVDYGIFKIFAEPLFWLLKFCYQLTHNWGWAIVLLTIAVKLAFFPLQAASYRAMAKMKEVTPRLTKLREQFGDDRLKLNQAMMDLYKKEKINPAAGCLPVLVQIPVFIALYWVLLGAVELRQAPWIGWIHDLSLADPLYVLPILMLISMLIQTKMNPTPPDPVQAKVMMIMPFVFGVMFFWFPAGLVLYWFVNNLFSIAQQWYISRKYKAEHPAKA